MRGSALLLVAALGVVSCTDALPPSGPTAPPGSEAPPRSALPTPTPPRPSPAPALLPDPDAPIPASSSRLAGDLVAVTGALQDSIEQWTSLGHPSQGRPPRAVVLQALYQQRIYGTIARDPSLRSRVLALLPRALRSPAEANVTAGAKLLSVVSSAGHPGQVRVGPPPPAGKLRGWCQRAEARFGVDWELLAAVMFVESRFGRLRSASGAGAQGPMQFLSSTWAAYGLGGDVHDPRDAIMGAANYLRASGAPQRERHALYRYNPTWAYVDAIEAYANQMRGDPVNFYAYYNWQVFVVTDNGPVRLTGPGA